MTQREALIIIINSLREMPEEKKNELLALIPTLTDEEVEQVGTYMARLKVASLEQAKEIQKNVDIFLKKLHNSEEEPK